MSGKDAPEPPGPLRIRRRVVVRGRVQGVCFRAATEQQAVLAGVDGWVRNLRDGALEAVFEGDLTGVEALLAFVHRGPRHAEVSSVEVRQEPLRGERGFRIRG